MFRALGFFTLALVALAAFTVTPATAEPSGLDPAIARKLHDLGYPSDAHLAIQRWRSEHNRTGEGPLTPDESNALLAQPNPQFYSAMTGNPYTGMGLALRHEKREDAEREAVRFCKAQGGGAACTAPLVVRAEQCVVVIGYTVKIDRRPHHRVSIAISPDIKLARARGIEGCQTGATHPQLCRAIVSYCGDGSQFQPPSG